MHDTHIININFFSGADSRTKKLYELFKAVATQQAPNVRFTDLNLADLAPMTLSVDELTSRFVKAPNEANQLLNCDGIIISFPIWNYGVPAQLKGFLDRAVVPKFTFDWTAAGFQSKLAQRPVLILSTAGGNYEEAAPMPFYPIIQLFKFLQTQVCEPVFVQGLDMPPNESTQNIWKKVEAQMQKSVVQFFQNLHIGK